MKPENALKRRDLLAYAAFGSAAIAAAGKGRVSAAEQEPAPRPRYSMKKSINLWAFPYPDKMSLKQCLQLAKDAGF
ncbi:MAG: sugar phosphate isomerase/epimerase, partial [Planctomycetes bacterium]|nr:sugar phosphate isomerase/epimerase [Planctomycetota bacterium]